MKVLGISPLDKDASASLVEDGRVLFASGEERWSRRKQHSGFPERAIREALERTGTRPQELDLIAYPFLEWHQEAERIEQAFAAERAFAANFRPPALEPLLAAAERRVHERSEPIHGLAEPNFRKRKGWLKELFYTLAGVQPFGSALAAKFYSQRWARRAALEHRHWQAELEAGLARLELRAKLVRSDHHASHAANAYLASGFERALVVTLDGYGSGLAGTIGLGEGGSVKRLAALSFPHSLGSFYEMVTSSLGFQPDRHAGKIVGLAAWGDPAVLEDVLLSRAKRGAGDLALFQNLNVHLSRHLAARFPIVDVAAAYQRVLELLARELVAFWLAKTGAKHLVLSGGVTANVKMNQRLHELDGVAGTFVYPNMGDGGCGTGLALQLSWPGGVRESFRDVYFGPEFGPSEIRAALEEEHLPFEEPADLPRKVAEKIHGGLVVARFAGRMEYGPRALGNRSILYHGREPKVNQWLNQRLARTEFMPFAPVTKWEARESCYQRLAGAEHAAEFMTLTFDCTERMRRECPAAVHVDGTARPQLIRRDVNPDYWRILDEYERLSGIPSLINTSFNMHEEPIVCTPRDAVRAFLDGRIDALAIPPYWVENPRLERR
ncbi:MAG: carbamoyltransferase [Planctomycetes bacterium]|nr:carbamoyltransferase [Planctomycetota bacterium]